MTKRVNAWNMECDRLIYKLLKDLEDQISNFELEQAVFKLFTVRERSWPQPQWSFITRQCKGVSAAEW